MDVAGRRLGPLLAARLAPASGGDEADAVALVLEAGEVAPAAVLALVLRGWERLGVGDDDGAGRCGRRCGPSRQRIECCAGRAGSGVVDEELVEKAVLDVAG